MLKVTLPWPPKELNPNNKTNWHALSRVKKKYRATCHLLTLEALKGAGYARSARQIDVHLTFVPPDCRHRDQDNMVASMKAGLDGVASALRVDDVDFDLSFSVDDGVVGGMVKVEIA